MLRLAWNMCHRKRRYSVREANRVVQRINEKGGKQVHQYHCYFCKTRHVGRDLEIEIEETISVGLLQNEKA